MKNAPQIFVPIYSICICKSSKPFSSHPRLWVHLQFTWGLKIILISGWWHSTFPNIFPLVASWRCKCNTLPGAAIEASWAKNHGWWSPLKCNSNSNCTSHPLTASPFANQQNELFRWLMSDKLFWDAVPVSRADRIPCSNYGGKRSSWFYCVVWYTEKVTDLWTEWMPWELQ